MPTLDDVLNVYRKKVIGWQEFENELKGVLERLIDTTQRFNYPATGYFKQTKIISDANDTFTLWYNTKEQNGTDGVTQPGSVAKKFASAGATFTEADVGKLIYIWGASDDDNNGVYKITQLINANNVYVDHDFNSNETSLGWELNRPVGCNCRFDTNYRIVELMNEKFYDLNGYLVTKNPLTWRIPFENNTGTTYSIGVKRISIPYDLEINVRNGRSYYRAYRETIGEVGTPDSVDLVSGNPKLIIDAIVNPNKTNNEDHSGKKARVWLLDPQSRTRVEGMEEVSIQYSAGQNFIQCAGKLGQVTSSTTATDYVVAVESVTWRDKVNKDLSADPDYAFTGEITGNGPAATPSVFNITGQVVFGSDVTDTLNINQLAKDLYAGGIGDLHGDGVAEFTNPFESWAGVQHYGPDDSDYGKHEDITFKTCYGQVDISGIQILLQAKDVADNSAIKFVVRDNTPTDRIKLYPKGDIVADGDLTIGDGADNLTTLNGKLLAGANGFWGANILSIYNDVAILEDKAIYLAGKSGGTLPSGFRIFFDSGTSLITAVGAFKFSSAVQAEGVDLKTLDHCLQIQDAQNFETTQAAYTIMFADADGGTEYKARFRVWIPAEFKNLYYSFDLASNEAATTAFAKVYIDGVAVGSEEGITANRNKYSTDDWETCENGVPIDLTAGAGYNDDDFHDIEIWGKIAGGNHAYVRSVCFVITQIGL